jgi:hypothetical protein
MLVMGLAPSYWMPFIEAAVHPQNRHEVRYLDFVVTPNTAPGGGQR